jgi:hypothetical protein
MLWAVGIRGAKYALQFASGRELYGKRLRIVNKNNGGGI